MSGRTDQKLGGQEITAGGPVTGKQRAAASCQYLTFWGLCLDNLPAGRFERRALSAADARMLIDAARENNTLRCVSRDDLFAPYRQRERRNHDALRVVLQKSFDMALSLEDFVITAGDKDGASQITNPLQLACLQAGDRLLVVTCDYAFDKRKKSDDVHDLFTIAEDTVRFDLIEALATGQD
jgi:hypothetical protein